MHLHVFWFFFLSTLFSPYPIITTFLSCILKSHQCWKAATVQSASKTFPESLVKISVWIVFSKSRVRWAHCTVLEWSFGVFITQWDHSRLKEQDPCSLPSNNLGSTVVSYSNYKINPESSLRQENEIPLSVPSISLLIWWFLLKM